MFTGFTWLPAHLEEPAPVSHIPQSAPVPPINLPCLVVLASHEDVLPDAATDDPGLLGNVGQAPVYPYGALEQVHLQQNESSFRTRTGPGEGTLLAQLPHCPLGFWSSPGQKGHPECEPYWVSYSESEGMAMRMCGRRCTELGLYPRLPLNTSYGFSSHVPIPTVPSSQHLPGS